jgi:hypothetical protein
MFLAAYRFWRVAGNVADSFDPLGCKADTGGKD